MRINKTIILSALLGSALLSSCDNGFEEMNISPNAPENAPTYTIFPIATKIFVDEMRDGWVSGRMLLPWVQYSAQRNYTEEDKYAYRTTTGDQAWNGTYRSLSNLKKVIDICNDPVLGPQQADYGDVESQIAAARIMMAYEFLDLTNYFGDVPYWSVSGAKNPDFQALQIDTYAQPKYVKQEVIFKNLLQELKEAEAQLNSKEKGLFTSPEGKEGDKIYNGDAALWKKLANSLRLRIANRVKAKLPEAQSHITDAITRGVFTSNEDNAQLAFGNVSAEGNPFWKTFYVDNRQDFFPNKRFVDLLKGNTGNFQKVDPRLFIFAAPKGLTWSDYTKFTRDKWKDNVGIDPDDIKNYNGVPYGIPNSLKGDIADFTKFNIFSKEIINTTRPEVLIEFAEVSFILSELNGWDQVNYLKGVEASLDKWGVSAVDKATYLAGLAPATQENVMVQKYIALFMQGDEAWNEYRRTGYPTGSILLLPGQKDVSLNGTEYTFNPMRSGNVVAKDIPARLRYPANQQTLNGENWRVAVDKLSNKDEIDSKLFFAK